MANLPVDEVLGVLLEGLSKHGHAVVVAPPGSGKTTRVPVALLERFGRHGQVVVTQPRRAAARVVARYVSQSLPKGRVGYEVRGEREVSSETALRFVTEGVLLAQLLSDPELSGISCVVIDEFHERSLVADLLLALLVETSAVLRDDLHIVVMSATLAAEPVSEFLGGAPIVTAMGRQYPVEVRYVPEQSAVGAALAACEATDGGDVLVFLPGVREIDRAYAAIQSAGVDVRRLHGALPLKEQDQVIRSSSIRGGPRVVLSTNIAETSLTLPGVTAVVDSGLVKQHRHDPASGIGRLELREHSQASAEQRAGRAGRVRPGVAWRLWSEREQRARAPFDPPSIGREDLAPLLLSLRRWGVTDAERFAFFEPPPRSHLARAESLLAALGAVESARGPLTAMGQAMAVLPMHPRVARFLLEARALGVGGLGCQVAMLLEEPRWFTSRNGGGESHGAERSDIGVRLRRFHRAPSGPRRAGEKLAQRYAKALGDTSRLPQTCDHADEAALCRALLAGWPDRVATRREEGRAEVVMGSRQGALLSRDSAVKADRWLLALDVGNPVRSGGPVALPLIRSAAGLSWEDLECHPWFRVEDTVQWDPERMRAVSERQWRLGDTLLKRKGTPLEDRASAAEVLREVIERMGAEALERLGLERAAVTLLGRLKIVSPDVEPWRWVQAALPGACAGQSSLASLVNAPLAPHILAALPWDIRGKLDTEAPLRLRVPSGRQATVTYRLNAPPSLAVKPQEMFGVTEGPRLGRVPVRLELLDPAGRPLAVTDDLGSFWSNAWSDVRKQMRGRYPKHRWPEDPGAAEASVKSTKPRPRRS